MRVICCYCRSPMPDKPGQCPGYPDAVSHGICATCYEALALEPPAPVRTLITWTSEPCLCVVCNWHAAEALALIEGLYRIPVCRFCAQLSDKTIMETIKRPRKET